MKLERGCEGGGASGGKGWIARPRKLDLWLLEWGGDISTGLVESSSQWHAGELEQGEMLAWCPGKLLP